MSLLKFILGKNAIKAAKEFFEEDQPQQPQPPERPEPLTEAQMADPIQRSVYEANMKNYMEWEQAQMAQQPQPSNLLNLGQ